MTERSCQTGSKVLSSPLSIRSLTVFLSLSRSLVRTPTTPAATANPFRPITFLSPGYDNNNMCSSAVLVSAYVQGVLEYKVNRRLLPGRVSVDDRNFNRNISFFVTFLVYEIVKFIVVVKPNGYM